MQTQSTKERAELLGTERIGRLLVQFAVPAILMMMVSSLYNIVDKAFVGNLVGDMALSATTVAGPIMRILSACSLLIGGGGSSLLALRLGEGKHQEAERILNNSFCLMAVTMLALTAVGLCFTDQILSIFRTSDEVMGYARIYLRFVLFGAVFDGMSSGLGLFIRTDGSPKRMMVCSMTGCIANIILDPLFIAVFKLGIGGAALATALSQAISGLMVIHYFTLSAKSTIKLHTGMFRIGRELTATTVKLGTSSFLQQFLGAIVNALLLWSLNFYAARDPSIDGDLAVASVGVTVSVGLFFLMPIMGMQQAIQPIVGYNYGAKLYARVRNTLSLGLRAAIAYGTVGWLIMMLFAQPLSRIFGADGAFLKQAAFTLRVYNLFFPIVAISSLGSNFFQAIGKPVQAVFISMSRQLIFLVPMILLLPPLFGVNGVFYSLPVADFGSTVVAGILLWRECGRLKELERLPSAQNPI